MRQPVGKAPIGRAGVAHAELLGRRRSPGRQPGCRARLPGRAIIDRRRSASSRARAWPRTERLAGADPAHEVGDLALEGVGGRSEEHTSELQSLMRISYAVFCLKKKTKSKYITHYDEKTTHTID